jgi:diguanylate cyclase (GGDEF)-like protein
MANDQLGHAAGDALLRRAGEVLSKAVDKPRCAARIGGDEFALLLPGTDERDGKLVLESIENLLEVNNQFYTGLPLSFAMGLATSEPGERLEAVVRRADLLMYEAKRAYYAALTEKGDA